MTGASGHVGSVLRPALSARLGAVRLIDVRPPPGTLAHNEELARCDITDGAALTRVLEGVLGVVHLMAITDDVAFDEVVAANVIGTHRLLEAARTAGARRVVLASSNHVTGMYSTDQTIDVAAPVRPDGFYAVSKVAGEALGRLYADKYGVEVVAVRIGSCVTRPREARHRHTWLSPRDTVAAFWAAMTCQCAGFAVFYGVSANTRRWWSLAAGEALGYRPVDDAERVLGPGASYHGVQGGEYAAIDPRPAPN